MGNILRDSKIITLLKEKFQATFCICFMIYLKHTVWPHMEIFMELSMEFSTFWLLGNHEPPND